jgi:hypothetical protein
MLPMTRAEINTSNTGVGKSNSNDTFVTSIRLCDATRPTDRVLTVLYKVNNDLGSEM